jgi:type IV pilus assembly protein PilB
MGDRSLPSLDNRSIGKMQTDAATDFMNHSNTKVNNRFKALTDLLVDTPVVHQVNTIIGHAVDLNASDIHIEIYENIFRVRYRIDGILMEAANLSPYQKDAIVSRIKIMANLDIAEKRRPQDGRVRFNKDGEDIDLRVSTLPTGYGEKIVLRILDKTALNLNLEHLGFDDDDIQIFRKNIHLPYGMILVTGPTGSGKTTTLYGALSELNSENVNITTIEDPVEYDLVGINQTQVNSDISLTFSEILRSILRQDPNIIMVGEIRDRETAEIATRAALTGHMVLSTLHTNDAPSAITRLIDLGVEPFLVSSCIRMVVAQRLVRKVCGNCSVEKAIDFTNKDHVNGLKKELTEGEGCEKCNGTGYKGRLALFEILEVNSHISELISEGAGQGSIKREAVDNGMKSLREAGLQKINLGQTTLQEVLRETSLEV